MVVESRTEAFTELYDADTGHNLRHWRQGPPDNDPHITGEDCPCGPERVAHEDMEVTGDIEGVLDATVVPKCVLCQRERTLQDAYDYNPLQVVTGQPLGWYSADDGEMCGACMTAMIRGGQ